MPRAIIAPRVLLVLLGLGGCAQSDPLGAGAGGQNAIPAGGSATGAAGAGGAAGGGASGGDGGAGNAGNAGGGAAGGAGNAGSAGGSAGAGGAPSDDPCAGVPDGQHCGSELGGLADHASLYVCTGGVTTNATGCPAGCENDACSAPPADPCASATSGDGLYCGGSLLNGDASKLYLCQGGQTSSASTCPSGCTVMPPGVADQCASSGDPCAQANAGNGLYCGSSLGAGAPDTLYDCQGGSTASATPCANGCLMNPPGTPDACASGGGGSCCLEAPPGVLTQAYSACGNGGSHYGRDYGAAMGTPLYAGMSGTVVGHATGFPNCYDNGCSQSCWSSFNYVKLKADCGDPDVPGNDFFLYYLHVDALAPGIANGTHVEQNELLAYVGNSGCSSGPHVHIEAVSKPSGQGATLSTCASVDPASRFCN